MSESPALRCTLVAAGTSAVTFGLWIALVIRLGLFTDYKYLFFVNTYSKPNWVFWPVVSFWWSLHGLLWFDHILAPLAVLAAVSAMGAAATRLRQRAPASAVGGNLLQDPVFGASILAVAGYIFFMTWQNHPQPRYFAVAGFFCIFVVAQAAAALLRQPAPNLRPPARLAGWAVLVLAASAVLVNGAWTLSYAAHPEYTFIDAARKLRRAIDSRPNGRRLLVSVSGDQISLATGLPAMGEEFGTQPLPERLANYRPRWFAAWNTIDPGTLEALHIQFSIRQVAAFRIFDDPDRNLLVLFELQPLPNAEVRDAAIDNLEIPLPGDQIEVPID
jgi:hypothetical protein